MPDVELQQIGPYSITQLLSVSSTSSFYQGKQPAPRKKDVIIKRLNTPLNTPEAKEAFLTRAKKLKKLKNRAIVDVQDANFDGDYGYLVMEYVTGETLRQHIPVGEHLAADEVKRILSPVAGALHYAHVNNTLHGNLHPGNILVGTHHDYLLTEFSLSLPDLSLMLDDEAFAIPYMAPEHLRGQPTAASDQYALAVMAYEWLCGRRPYEATERELLLQQQEQAPLPPLHSLNEAVSPTVERVIIQALSYNPQERFPHAQAFADGYLSALMGFPVKVSSVTRPVTPSLPIPSIRNENSDMDTMNHVTTVRSPVVEQFIAPIPATSNGNGNKNTKKHKLIKPDDTDKVKRIPTNEQAKEDIPQQLPPPRLIALPAQPPAPLSLEDARLQKTIATDLRQGGILSQRLPGYEERPAQIEMATLVAHALTEDVPAIIEAGTGTGKALDVDTPIPTPTGWKRMGDLAVGDSVFDEKGNPTPVTAAFDVMYQRKCYEVVLSDGSSLVADAEHEWVSYTCADRARANDDRRVYTLVTTEEMAATLTVGPAKHANHAVAVTGALALPEANLPIAPYFLGVWLGDSDSPGALALDLFGFDQYTFPLGVAGAMSFDDPLEGTETSNQITPADSGLITELEKDGYKHIPMPYLRASEQQRRALLAGLLDTDGTVNGCGAVEFTTTNPRLAQDTYELVCSLGFRASLRQGQAHYNGKDCGPKWTLAFTTDEPVFRLERKVATHKERLRNYSPERNHYRYVVAVREVPSRPVRCIQVESPSHLYLAGRAMIPTHNSLAYLVPIVRSGKVAIVSTANKGLQEQLFYKDIPFVQKHIKHFDAALVKGVANYLCLDRLEAERTGLQFYAKNRDFQRLVDITNDPHSSFTGDFETLGFQLPADIRSKVATDSDQCAWMKCGFYADCYIRKMREQAERAKIIVVNHTLLLLDAAIGGFLLPKRDVIVIDEAHHLEEEATRSFTVTINPTQITTLLAQRMLKAYSQLNLQAEAEKAAHETWIRLAQVADPGYKGRINLAVPLEEGLHLATAIANLADSLRKQRPPKLEDKEDQLYDKLLKRTENLADDIRTVFSVADTQKFVYYVERISTPGQRGFHLQASAAPLDVTTWLRERLFDKCNVICTSATLATIGPNPAKPEDKGPNFAYFRRRVGLDPIELPDVLENILPLSFDYESNALLYLPRDLPEPTFGSGSDDYMKAIAREMYRLVKLSRGRAFLLFSSKRMLDRAYELMSPHLPYPLLKQGDMTRLELTRRFRAEEGSVLFGLKSFWEGVDIAGDALSLVVIDKLPFDPPDDPVHEARVAQMKAAGENWFGTYVLPQAVLRLKQGLGRLLRTRDDRGVMAILDTRLHTKGYGKMVLNGLPPARRTSSIRDVERFFAE